MTNMLKENERFVVEVETCLSRSIHDSTPISWYLSSGRLARAMRLTHYPFKKSPQLDPISRVAECLNGCSRTTFDTYEYTIKMSN